VTNAEAVAVVLCDLLGRTPTVAELSVVINVLVALGVDPDAELNREIVP
jgi:hypothetical protein